LHCAPRRDIKDSGITKLLGNIAAIAGVFLAACGSTSAPAPERDEHVEAEPEREPGPLADAGQLIVGVTPDWDSADVELRLYERDAAGVWQPVGNAWPGTVGAAGIAWGRGLHGEGAPVDRAGPVKVEGDKRAPAGIFTVMTAYGYAEANVQGAKIPYDEVTPSWRCVDDSSSPYYNKVFNADGRDETWKSAEHMRRTDDQYEWVIEIGHNQAATPMGGSCIFFHVWSGAGNPTVGCTAMTKPTIETLLAELDPAAKPAYVLLPAAEYDALRDSWHLP
jgi:D-alanyl-D-alanine dipeptidase